VYRPRVSDRWLLNGAGFVRAIATSLVGVLIGVYLARTGLSSTTIGLTISLGLAGTALGATIATFAGDRIGRRRFLVLLAVASAAGTLAFALAGSPWLLAAGAFVGMLNGMGRDRGGALVIEQAALPATVAPEQRTQTIAVYTMLQDIGHALGSLAAGVPTLLERTTRLDGAAPHRATLVGCAVLCLVPLLLYARLGTGIDAAAPRRLALAPRSRGILARICALFAVDSLAGGFLTTALLSYFFFERFGAGEVAIGVLFFGARVMNAGSHLLAARLATRIGLVNTMVFTHIPSSLLLVTVAFAPSFPVAAALFLLREGLVEMDVPTRQSYVLAVVQPEERTFASGVTNLVRVASWAVAPAFAGLMLGGRSFYLPLVIGAAMKIAYDVLLWRAFRKIRPPEES
jgi:MFS family permease